MITYRLEEASHDELVSRNLEDSRAQVSERKIASAQSTITRAELWRIYCYIIRIHQSVTKLKSKFELS